MISDEIFKSSNLCLPTNPPDIQPCAALWSDCIVNRIGIILAVVLMVGGLRNYLRLMPDIWDCVSRSRGSIRLEHSVSTARSRDIAALILVLPFCLVVDRFGMYPADFVLSASAIWRLPVTLGIVAGYLVLRDIALALSGRRLGRGDLRSAAHNTLLNYFIALCTVMLPSVGIILLTGTPEGTASTILLVETGAFYLFSTLRTIQILGSGHSVLSTFLYLCALEFLPAGALVAAALVI